LSSPARALLPLWREAFQTSRRTSSRASVTQETTWNGSYVQLRIMRRVVPDTWWRGQTGPLMTA